MARILIVEDSASQRMLLQQMLEKRGYEVTTIESGRDAIKYLKSVRNPTPDVVLMDINMPGKSGIETTEFLKKNAKTAAVKIIAVSATLEGRGVSKAISAGFDAIHKKPVDIKELVRKIEDLIGAPQSE